MSDEPTEIRSLIQSGYRYALSLTHNSHDAEDLIQQACLKALHTRKTLPDRAYLFSAVRNLFIDQCRRRSVVAIESLENTEVPRSKSSDHVKRIDDRLTIQQLLSKLRPIEREVLYLNCVEGYSAREISELTDSPRGSVLSLLSRAKAKLSGTKENAASGREISK